MRRPILLLIIMAISFSQIEITSQDTLKGVIFPLLFSAVLLILIIWLVRQFHSNRSGDGLGDSGGGYFVGGKNSERDSGDSVGDGGGE